MIRITLTVGDEIYTTMTFDGARWTDDEGETPEDYIKALTSLSAALAKDPYADAKVKAAGEAAYAAGVRRGR